LTSDIIQIFWFWIATFAIWLISFPFFIDFLKTMKLWKQIREEATIGKAIEFLKLHKNKVWTPTMWGAMILGLVFFMVIISMIFQYFWLINHSLLSQKETYLVLFTLFTVWVLWGIDDYMNIKWIWRTKWLSARFKMFWLLIFSLLWWLWFYYKLWFESLNFWIFWEINLWIWFIALFVFVIVATANSVNITDWLDWLAWWLLLFSYSLYAYITYDKWFLLLSTLCIAIIWALIAFLWFNVKPAKVYMWDIWSLSLWAWLWIIAFQTNTVWILMVIWMIFILETLSVIIQLTSKKLRKWKKIFRIAPFHHHLEAIGRTEENVVFRFWLIWLLLTVIWIILYKL
jgi:phospho-N-acetylmuramoyl-pentapeptide-transferase